MNLGVLRNAAANPTPLQGINPLWSLVPLIGGLMLLLSPKHHRVWGGLILAFGIASWVLLGSLLADIAGVLAIRWVPPITNAAELQQIRRGK